MIRLDEVTRRYGQLTAVDRVSFEVGQNEIVGFVGPNGAGKSTVLKMLSTYIYPTAGRITVDGLDVREHALVVHAVHDHLLDIVPPLLQMA